MDAQGDGGAQGPITRRLHRREDLLHQTIARCQVRGQNPQFDEACRLLAADKCLAFEWEKATWKGTVDMQAALSGTMLNAVGIHYMTLPFTTEAMTLRRRIAVRYDALHDALKLLDRQYPARVEIRIWNGEKDEKQGSEADLPPLMLLGPDGPGGRQLGDPWSTISSALQLARDDLHVQEFLELTVLENYPTSRKTADNKVRTFSAAIGKDLKRFLGAPNIVLLSLICMALFPDKGGCTVEALKAARDRQRKRTAQRATVRPV